MAHRFLALVIAAGVIACLFRSRAAELRATPLARLADVWFLLLACQITLGAWVIWSNKAADIATAHVAVGATMLALGVTISTFSLRLSATSQQALTPGRYLVSEKAARIMKTVALPSVNLEPAAVEGETRRRMGSDFAELVKARLTLLVLLTTAVGFYLGAARPHQLRRAFPRRLRHGAGRGGRGRPQSMVGTAARRAHAAHKNKTHSRRPYAAAKRRYRRQRARFRRRHLSGAARATG